MIQTKGYICLQLGKKGRPIDVLVGAAIAKGAGIMLENEWGRWNGMNLTEAEFLGG
jgi:hypothetical protein